ncbi:hypothetical protein Golomagni_06210 [Golovinomyces magnicellulatus]|nr:hypothetical protein Golomagni_06210 [Golovinomyces magnicellulatus]
MALEIHGKTALVTGGASGIGLAFSHKLLDGGCNVVIADLTLPPKAQELLDTKFNGASASFVKTDVTNWSQLQAAFDHAIQEFKQLDIVFPCAGIFDPPDVSNFWYINQGADTVESSSFKAFELNITHPVRTTQLAIDSFKRQKLNHGVVVLISSIAAQLPLLPTPLYSASKHAISGFVRCMAALEPALNIRINGVAPGLVKTPIWTKDKLTWVDEDVDKWVTVDQVADVLLDLVTNKEHVGGTILEVGVSSVRPVTELGDAGPQGDGFTVQGLGTAFNGVFDLIDQNFGK